MSEKEKIWKKKTSYFTQIDYTTDDVNIKKGLKSISDYDEVNNRLVTEIFDSDGKLKSRTIMDGYAHRYIEYDRGGNEVSNNSTVYEPALEGRAENRKDFDSEGNSSEEFSEYGERDRVVKKKFVKNDEVHSYLEFIYDEQDKVIETRCYEDNELKWYDLHEDKDENMEITSHYVSDDNLLEQRICETKNDGKLFISSTYNELKELVKRIEEEYDAQNQVKEQRIFNEDNILIERIIFKREPESNLHKKITTIEYLDGKKMKENIIENIYEY
ncbi:MAG: hypothetical protein HND52_07360 [Ignavibacteriae bacterium]|nr:hypothetical protein [Ignavibacteriota bacterium]NOG97762.1 hypothetical protein [Ignavibacteriota bacterium]